MLRCFDAPGRCSRDNRFYDNASIRALKPLKSPKCSTLTSLRSPQKPGEIDHGVDTTATLESIQALYEGLPPLMSIIQVCSRITVDRLHRQGESSDASKKQAVPRDGQRDSLSRPSA